MTLGSGILTVTTTWVGVFTVIRFGLMIGAAIVGVGIAVWNRRAEVVVAMPAGRLGEAPSSSNKSPAPMRRSVAEAMIRVFCILKVIGGGHIDRRFRQSRSQQLQLGNR